MRSQSVDIPRAAELRPWVSLTNIYFGHTLITISQQLHWTLQSQKNLKHCLELFLLVCITHKGTFNFSLQDFSGETK